MSTLRSRTGKYRGLQGKPYNENKIPVINRVPLNKNRVPCNENRVPLNKNRVPCNENRIPCNENRIPCNENRFFLVRIDLQAVSCKSYRVWVCSVTLEQVRLILRSKSVGAMATPTISAGSVARAGL